MEHNALEWGAQVFADGAERETFSVATSLSNVCKLLNVEMLVEGADGVSSTWGAVGHYSIGLLAIDQVTNATLKAFLQADADRISLELDGITGDLKNKDRAATESSSSRVTASGKIAMTTGSQHFAARASTMRMRHR